MVEFFQRPMQARSVRTTQANFVDGYKLAYCNTDQWWSNPSKNISTEYSKYY